MGLGKRGSAAESQLTDGILIGYQKNDHLMVINILKGIRAVKLCSKLGLREMKMTRICTLNLNNLIKDLGNRPKS